MNELRKNRCCFTGHRPWKLHCDEKTIKKRLKNAIDKTIKDGYITFIVGMCYGIDLSGADIAKTISNNYCRYCYPKRNIWMVDRSARVIAAYNVESGGKKNTILYAKKHGIEVINILDK